VASRRASGARARARAYSIISPFHVLSSFCRNAPASPRSLQVNLQCKAREALKLHRSVLRGLQPPPRGIAKAQLLPATGRSKLSPGALKRRFSTTARRSSRMALDDASGGTYPIRQGKPTRVTMNGEACTPTRHFGHCSAHLIISLSLRLLAAICLAAGKCCPRISPPQKLKNNCTFSAYPPSTRTFRREQSRNRPASILGL
jgi:hypothetical protein